MKALLTTAAVFAAMMILVPAAFATSETLYFDNNGGNHEWSNVANWSTSPSTHVAPSDNSYPLEDDRAVILSSSEYCTISSQDAAADTLVVQSGAELNIEAQRQLTLDHDNGPAGDTEIAGTVNLNYDSENEYFSTLEFRDSNQAVSGSGSIKGWGNTCRLSISTSNTLTNETTIEGSMQIRAGSGTFQNNGTVEANHYDDDDDTLTLYSGTFSGGTSTCNEGYKVTESLATLLIGVGSPTITSLSADFFIEDGTLDIQASVATTGGMRFTGGTISVNAGCSFTATGALATCP